MELVFVATASLIAVLLLVLASAFGCRLSIGTQPFLREPHMTNSLDLNKVQQALITDDLEAFREVCKSLNTPELEKLQYEVLMGPDTSREATVQAHLRIGVIDEVLAGRYGNAEPSP